MIGCEVMFVLLNVVVVVIVEYVFVVLFVDVEFVGVGIGSVGLVDCICGEIMFVNMLFV